jgi:hypothetical protein
MLIRSEKGRRRLALSETWVRFGSQLSGECRAETEDDCERTYPISNIILVLPICAKQAFSHDLANKAYTGLFLCVPAVKSVDRASFSTLVDISQRRGYDTNRSDYPQQSLSASRL